MQKKVNKRICMHNSTTFAQCLQLRSLKASKMDVHFVFDTSRKLSFVVRADGLFTVFFCKQTQKMQGISHQQALQSLIFSKYQKQSGCPALYLLTVTSKRLVGTLAFFTFFAIKRVVHYTCIPLAPCPHLVVISNL